MAASTLNSHLELAKTLVDSAHSTFIRSRRVRVLSEVISEFLPQSGELLDVGCGDGRLARLIKAKRPGLNVRGIDTLIRKTTFIEVQAFDGFSIPFHDKSVDTVIFVDVLHHTYNGPQLLKEAARVARKSIVLKDHTLRGVLAGPTLKFMDWVGNAPHGVALPYNYWPEEKWKLQFTALGLNIAQWKSELGLYPIPFHWIFDRELHFVAQLNLQAT